MLRENRDSRARAPVPVGRRPRPQQFPCLLVAQFGGELLAEYSVEGLLRYGVPSDVLAKYAVALMDAKGKLLAGQTIPDRPGFSERLPWTGKVNEFDIPVSLVGNGLVLRAQAWRTSPKPSS